jgi:transposase
MRRPGNLGLAGLICYHPDGRRARLLAGHVVGAYNTHSLIALLQRLPALLDGAPVILVWDQLPAHHSIDMKTWLAAQTDWLQVVELPSYAPDLNPVEPMWSAVKGKDLANYAATDLADLWRAASRGLARIRRNPALLWSFLAATGLVIPSMCSRKICNRRPGCPPSHRGHPVGARNSSAVAKTASNTAENFASQSRTRNHSRSAPPPSSFAGCGPAEPPTPPPDAK